MAKLKHNFLANVVGRLWGLVSVYLFIPIYIRFLGIEAYGLVGFYTVLQGVLIIADVGFTATLNRELARLSALPGTEGEMRSLVRTLEILYWSIASLIGAVLLLSVDSVLIHWINPGSLHPALVKETLQLMILAVVFQLPATLYTGGLLGLERQVLANGLQIIWSVIRNGGVILLLILFSATLRTFFTWQILCNAIYSIVSGIFLWRSLPANPGQHIAFGLASVRKVWQYAAGMALLSVFTVLSLQVDKILVAKYISLKVYAFYSLASLISQVPVLVAGPISVAIFPKLMAFVAVGQQDLARGLYHRAGQVVSLLALPAGVVIALFARELVLVWTRSPEVAMNAAPMVVWFVAGFMIQAMLHIPFRLALAHSYLRISLILSVFTLTLVVPIMMFLMSRFGAVGGAMAWTILNLMQWCPFVYFVHKRLMPGANMRYYLVDVGIPLSAALLVGLAWKEMVPMPGSSLGRLASIGMCGVVAVGVGAIGVPGLLRSLWAQLHV